MVLLSENPLLNLDTRSVHQIDTNNTGNLHALWSVVSRCARTETLPNAQRLENLTWRLYSQQTLSQSPKRLSTDSNSYSIPQRDLSSESIPGLSQSPDSPISSDDEMGTPPDSDLTLGLHHMATMQSVKSISPDKFEDIVKSVTENNAPLTSLSLPTICPPSAQPEQEEKQFTAMTASQQSETEQIESSHHSLPRKRDVESSTSTMATTAVDSEIFESGYHGTADSTSTEISSMSIVRGFSKENISSVRRSYVQLAPPQPILKQSSPSPQPRQHNPLARNNRKKTTFMVGASSEGDESSYESPVQKSSLTQGLQGYSSSNDVQDHAFGPPSINVSFEPTNESAIEDDDEDEDAVEEDDQDGWEDDDDASQQDDLFRRVESKSNLRSRPSLLTNMLHETDRAKALQNAASRSTPAIRRSRTSSHNGPLGTSPQQEAQVSRARPVPVAQQVSESVPIPNSPRTNRRNMLSTELTGSLRKHLLWERQQRNPASKLLKNRQFRSEIKLTDHVAKPHMGAASNLRRNDTTNFYDNGLQEYFEKGW